MQWYPWLRGPFEQLINSHQMGRGHHALFLHAIPGLGDYALIYAISRWLMCQNPEGYKSCGRCHSCQLMLAGTHPDYYIISVEKGKSSLGIDTIREMTEKLYGYAQQGGEKVIWFPDADLMTDAAANALLKTLEEPPANTWFFLSSREPTHLPATLRSRCFYLHLMPPDEPIALAWLRREIDEETASLLAALRLNAGAPAGARELLQSGQWALRNQLYEKLEQAVQSDNLLSMMSVMNHDDAPSYIHWISTLLLDAIKWQRGIRQGLTNEDRQTLIAKFALLCSQNLLQALIRHWWICRDSLQRVVGVNRELLLTESLMTWAQMMRPGASLPPYNL